MVFHHTRLTAEGPLETVFVTSATKECCIFATRTQTPNIWMVRFEENTVLESFEMFCKRRDQSRCPLPKYHSVDQNVNYEKRT